MSSGRTDQQRPLQVVVVGAGPAGIYLAHFLLAQHRVPVSIDLVDRLPTPFGLVRYGVAPDHPKTRGIRDTLRGLLEDPRVRFIGNVDVGRDVSLADLRAHADVVVYAFGASGDRPLGIPGEDLTGCMAATELVSWYVGHPDADRSTVEAALSRTRSAVVLGMGNVALDVARILVRTPTELEQTDMPQHVLDTLARCPVREVTVIGRRGPVHAAFTTPELRELDRLANAAVHVEPSHLVLTSSEQNRAAADRRVTRNLEVLRAWSENPDVWGDVPLRLAFRRRPTRVVGEARATGLEVERTVVDDDGTVCGTGEMSVLPADLVVRAVGSVGQSLPGLPVGPDGTVAHLAGRVVRDGQVSTAEYVTGWIKRGATGVVGSNKRDARETATSVLDDALAGRRTGRRPLQDLRRTLEDRGVDVVSIADWDAMDAAEVDLGRRRGRARTTLHERGQLLQVARGTSTHDAVPPEAT